MPKVLILCSVMFCLFLLVAVSPAQAQMYEPINAIQLGVGYQYQHYNVFNRQFSDNGYNVDLYAHIVDWLTDPDWRITVGGEANTAFGFGGETNGTPQLSAKSLFVGGGPRVAFENRSRIDPWLHGLVGLEHFRFSQSSGGLGSNSSLGFMVGGGADIKLSEGIRWRVQADYIGSTFQSSEQSNFSVGTGFVLVF
jgi:opacity protein-like surface antigen